MSGSTESTLRGWAAQARLTVALASTQREWHGGEEQARLLLSGLRRRGWRCVVLGRRDGRFADRMAAEGFETFTFGGNGRSPTELWRIRRCLRRLQPDVLHYNDAHAVSGVGLAAAGLPIAARVAARRTSFPIHAPRLYRWLCDRVACVSRPVAQVCRQCGIPDAMLRVVHDGVDPDRVGRGDRLLGRGSLGVSEDEILLVTVAKLTDCKGHRFLLDALPAVIQGHPRLTVAFAGDGELRQPLEQQVRRLGLEHHVRFLGYRHDVPDLIQAADLLVHPAHHEGLCSTIIDAMLAGRTIVTTTAGGIPDLIGSESPSPPAPLSEGEGSHESPASLPKRDGICAWTVPPCDPPALAEAILRALASPQASAAMLDRARRRAEAMFTADRMVEATLAVYRGMRDER